MRRRRIDYPRLLRDIQDKTGDNQGELARRFGVTQPTISRWMKPGGMDPERMNADKILEEARELGLIQVNNSTDFRPIPIVGYVGAGGEAHFYGEGQGPLGEASMPPKGASEYMVAVVVRGDSMAGQADEGWLVYYDTRHEPPTESVMGRLCVTGLPDGRVLIKKLLPGSRQGVYHLVSSNAAPLVDQPVEWAAPVAWIEPQ